MRRTFYSGITYLLTALSVMGQTGPRNLNPIESQKLQLPALPASQTRASMLRSDGSVDYAKGTFIVNEDWYGHQNSSVNFLSDNGTWTYNAFQKENPGKELGCTSQFGTIYGGLLYIVSKQEKDPSASVIGSRLAVIDAKTMKLKKEFQTLNGADGRSFLGVDQTKGYIGTSNGIYVYHTGYDINNGTYDVDKMLIEPTPIEGTTGISASDLYHSQVGTMLRVNKYVFAVHQTKGLLVIDPEKDEVIKTLLKPEDDFNHGLGSIVLSKDGNLWASVTLELTGGGSTMPYMWKVNPYTLTTQRVDIPVADGIEEIPNSWYAWTADGFCASTKENKIYWKGQGTGSWFTGYKIFCYDIDKNTFYKVFDFTKLTGDWRLYGTGFRVDPVSDNMYCFLYHEFLNPEHELAIVKLDGRGETNGTIVGRYPYEKINYWFPALPVFPDNLAPTIKESLPDLISFTAEHTKFSKSMEDILDDSDNMISAVVTTIVNPNPELINAEIVNNTLTIAPVVGSVQDAKEILLKLSFNSNGKVVNKEVLVKLTTTATAPFEFKEKSITLDGKEKSATLLVNGLADETLEWNSSHPKIATVLEDGTVTSHAYGTVEIRVTSKMRPTMFDVCTLIVKRPAMVLKDPSVVMYPDESKSLIILSNGVESGTEEVEWKSSDESIVAVGPSTIPGSPHPMIYSHSAGEAEITATVKSKETGEVLAVTKCKVKVQKYISAESIELRLVPSGEIKDPVAIEINSFIELAATVYPEDASDKDIKWSSSNPNFLVSNGIVTARSDGEAIITAVVNGEVSASCNVKCDFEYKGASFENEIVGYKVDYEGNNPNGCYAKIKFDPVRPSYIKLSEVRLEDLVTDDEYPEYWEVSLYDDNTVFIQPDYGYATGTATIIAKVLNTKTNVSQELSCKLVVSEWVKSFKLIETSKHLRPQETLQLNTEIEWGDMTPNSLDVKYSAADNTVVSVDGKGLVKALKQGKTTVKAYLSDGSYSGVCEIIVADVPATKVIIKEKEIRLKQNESIQLQAMLQPENASFGGIVWSGQIVSKDGFFKGNSKVGKFTVYATSGDGLASDTCVIYVDGEIPLESFSVEPKEFSIDKSETEGNKGINFNTRLKFNFYPMNASILSDIDARNPVYDIENEDVIGIVDKLYKAKKVGSAKIAVGLNASGLKDEILIHVTDKSLGVLGITLEASQIVMSKDEVLTLGYTVQPDPLKPDVDTNVTWSSSDETVAIIDPSTGSIRALGDGETIIRVTTNVGGFVAACTLSVGQGIIKVTGVSLDQDRLELITGHSAQLRAIITPENAKTKTVNWTSENRLVAEVDKDGNVQANKEGTVMITATTLDGGFTATCKVIVSPIPEPVHVTNVSLNMSSLLLKKGETAVLTASITPSDAADKTVVWSTSDPSVASIANDGTVTAGIAGSATATVTTNDGGYTATCDISVVDADLDKPVVEPKDSTATLTFPKVLEATFYEVSVYKYINEIPVLFDTYTVDAEGTIIIGLRSNLRSGSPDKIAISLRNLDSKSEYIVKITAIKEKDGQKETLGTYFSEPFETSDLVGNEVMGTDEISIYYSGGQLHLNNLEGYRCYIVSPNGAVLEVFEITGKSESRLISYSKGTYIITVIKKDNDRISKKIVVN